MEGWKFKILTWQETNRRWDGPIANSFRVERTPCSLLPPPIHWTSSPPPPLSATSVVFSLLFFFVSLFLSLPLLVRSPFPLLHPTVGWSVGAVLVFKDLITDSSLILSCGTPSRHLGLHLLLLLLLLHLLLFFHLFLIQPGQPWPLLLLLLLLFFVFFLLGLLLTKVCGHPPFPRKRNETKEARKCKGGGTAMVRGWNPRGGG